MGKENPGNAVNLLCEGTVIVGDIKNKERYPDRRNHKR